MPGGETVIDETIEKIEETIESVDNIETDSRAELLGLLSRLKSEIATLPNPQGEHAKSITKFMDVSAHEATRQTKNPDLLDLSLKGLSSSVKDFEADHPKLAEIVDSICRMLSGIGI
jgi:hypothetical protein